MSTTDIKIKLIESINDDNRYLVRVCIPESYGFLDNLYMKVRHGNIEDYYRINFLGKEDGMVIFEEEVTLKTRAIYHYYFEYDCDGQKRFIKNRYDNDGLVLDDMFKMSSNFSVPDWAKGKVMYHIFVDRFNRGSKEKMIRMPRRTIHRSWNDEVHLGGDRDGIWNNDFFGGDIKGIIDKLDYLKSLGVSILYLSPVMMSQSNHRYDTSDYEQVDPYAGSNEDLKLLCDIAHRKGMKVILDAVFNHTGNDSKYFNEFGTFDTEGAMQNPESYYGSFYRKRYTNEGVKFDHWWGFGNLPECDGGSVNWQNYIYGENGVIDKWFSLGIDGLRLDVADELTDEFIEGIRRAVKRNKEDGFILGEVWKNPMRMGRSYIDSGKGMDSVMDYPLVDALLRYFKYGDVTKLAYIIRDIKREYPDETIYSLMNFTSTHDISRALNMFINSEFLEYGEYAWTLKNESHDYCRNFALRPEEIKLAREIYQAYVFTLAFMPGNLSIFYGDEIGMEGLGNLVNRAPFRWNYMDKKLLSFFRYIGSIRKGEQFLEQADLDILDINQRYLMFERTLDDDRMCIIVNRTSDNIDLSIPSMYEGSEKVYTLKKSTDKMLTPYGGIAIKK